MNDYVKLPASDCPWRTYFFTVVTLHRRPILCNEDVRTSLREAIRSIRVEHPFTIEGWVLLPDHLHCIWTLPYRDAGFSKRWALIKRYVSKRLQLRYHRSDWMTASKIKRRESTLWQRRFWEHQIRDEEDLHRHLDYLHFNPVKHGHAARVSDWPYSSFIALSGKVVIPRAGEVNSSPASKYRKPANMIDIFGA